MTASTERVISTIGFWAEKVADARSIAIQRLSALSSAIATPLPVETVYIKSSQTSPPFSLPCKLATAHVGTTSSSRTLKIQELDEDGEWIDSGVEVTTDQSNKIKIKPSDMVDLIPMMGRSGRLRLHLDGSDSCTVFFYPSN